MLQVRFVCPLVLKQCLLLAQDRLETQVIQALLAIQAIQAMVVALAEVAHQHRRRLVQLSGHLQPTELPAPTALVMWAERQ